MSLAQPAFGRIVRQLIELGVVEIKTEPLDARIDRRLKEFWENTSCPPAATRASRRGRTSTVSGAVIAASKPAYTYGMPFHEKHFSCGEVLLTFTLYADTLLSITQIAVFLERAYRTVYDAIREVEAAVHRGFPIVWQYLDQTIDGPTQVDESGKVCSGHKGTDPSRDSRHHGGSSQSGRSRWRGRHGNQVTLVAACRDVLRVIRGKHGIDYRDDLGPVIQEAEDLSQKLGEIWIDGLQAYREMDHDYQTVVHDETYVSTESVHINQVGWGVCSHS